MDKITLKPCCALCNKLWNKETCPLYKMYDAASNYGDDTFEEKLKYIVFCDDFTLSGKYRR